VKKITVLDVMRALESYPPGAEVWLDPDGEIHVHTDDSMTCWILWDGYNPPASYRPVYEIQEARP
jgi:hypothetical protein